MLQEKTPILVPHGRLAGLAAKAAATSQPHPAAPVGPHPGQAAAQGHGQGITLFRPQGLKAESPAPVGNKGLGRGGQRGPVPTLPPHFTSLASPQHLADRSAQARRTDQGRKIRGQTAPVGARHGQFPAFPGVPGTEQQAPAPGGLFPPVAVPAAGRGAQQGQPRAGGDGFRGGETPFPQNLTGFLIQHLEKNPGRVVPQAIRGGTTAAVGRQQHQGQGQQRQQGTARSP